MERGGVSPSACPRYAAVSIALVCATLLVGATQRYFWRWPYPHALHLAADFHVTVHGFRDLGDLSFYKDAGYGPYTGSLISVEIDGREVPEFARKRAFGRTWGIYYRDFLTKGGDRLWTFSISLWWFVFAFSMPALCWLVATTRRLMPPLSGRGGRT